MSFSFNIPVCTRDEFDDKLSSAISRIPGVAGMTEAETVKAHISDAIVSLAETLEAEKVRAFVSGSRVANQSISLNITVEAWEEPAVTEEKQLSASSPVERQDMPHEGQDIPTRTE